ncbi:MAG: hypothetical protein RR276_00060 [Angelakisella sp.]
MKLKNSVALAVAAAMLLSVTAFADAKPQPKDEVVYVNLTATGAVDSVYVVNGFDLTAPARLQDYGNYTELKNLTTTQPLTTIDGAVTVEAPAGRFYYQGKLESSVALPWTVAVSYQLDGRPISPELLAGQSGKLEITLGLATREDAPALYKEHFALQASLSLDSERCRNIVAPGATVANAGSNKQLSYMLLPGATKQYTLTADVTDFTLDGIQIAGVPMNMEFDKPDTSGVSGKLTDLKDGVAKLDDGAVELDDGVGALYEGVWELRDGTADLNDGVYQMVRNLPEMQSGAEQFTAGLAGMAQGAAGLAAGFSDPQLAQLQGGILQLAQGLSAVTGDQTLVPLLNQYFSAMSGLGQGTAALSGGLTQLSGAAGDLRSGIGSLSGGISELYQGTQGLKEGAQQLYEGVAELKDGTAELTDGTKEFRDESSTMDSKIDEEVDKLMAQYSDNDYTLSSFVNPKNTNVTGVQFVLKTAGVTKETVPVQAQHEDAPTTLWERITALFQ